MIKSAVTISLVDEARGGPFVFWDGLEPACARAAELGYDAIEVFAPGPDDVDADELHRLLETHDLKVAAVGTGAGMVKHGLRLTDPDADKRRRAIDFVGRMIDFGGPFGAPAIIGSMQGRWGDGVDRETALTWLRDALNQLGDAAARHGVPLIYEPLNRYETNMANTVEDGVRLLKSLSTENVRLLADLFHMNIEEADPAAAIRAGGPLIGHLHFVDSNRHAAGFGHLDFGPIAAALSEIGYAGYAAAEAFPLPDPDAAAVRTIETFNSLFR